MFDIAPIQIRIKEQQVMHYRCGSVIFVLFISAALARGDAVLVHCRFGVSKSSSLVTCYLMRTLDLSWKDALEHVQQRRWSARPNKGFIQQLQALDRSEQKCAAHVV